METDSEQRPRVERIMRWNVKRPAVSWRNILLLVKNIIIVMSTDAAVYVFINRIARRSTADDVLLIDGLAFIYFFGFTRMWGFVCVGV